jgi:hypothetical protein
MGVGAGGSAGAGLRKAGEGERIREEQASKVKNGAVSGEGIENLNVRPETQRLSEAPSGTRLGGVTDGRGPRLSEPSPEGNMPGSEREIPHRRGPA